MIDTESMHEPHQYPHPHWHRARDNALADLVAIEYCDLGGYAVVGTSDTGRGNFSDG